MAELAYLDAAIRAKLTAWGDDPCGYATCVVVGWSEMRAAIEAVLDLHHNDGDLGVCYQCEVPFPMDRTVRVIAEKLGVEVDRA